MNGPATSVHKLFMLFDRNHARHRWAKAFAELEQPARHWTHRLIANNWRMDHRLSPDREQAMLSSRCFASDPDDPDADKWWMQRGDYFFQELCRPAVPAPGGKTSAYVHSCNALNAIAVHAVPGHEQLIHIGSLNRILWRLLNTGTVGLKIDFEDTAGVPFPERRPGTDAWTEFNAEVNKIVAALQSQGPATVKAIAGLLCDGLGDTQPPWWACFAQEAAPLLVNKDWNTLCSALGLGHLEADEWLLIWRYDVSVAGSLYRPTVVEANDSPYHFTSPPTYPYGITMPLGTGMTATYREVLHPSLTGQTAIDACTGELGNITAALVNPLEESKLIELRRYHRERLQREFEGSSRDQDWFRRHEGLP